MKFPIKKVATMAAVALALPLAAIAPATQAATLITEWGYHVESGFTYFTETAGDNGVMYAGASTDPDGDGTSNARGELQWSDDSGATSSIYVDPVVDSTGSAPNLFTDGAAVAGASVFHDNNVISASAATLRTATLLTGLTLDPINPDLSKLPTQTLQFQVAFTETLNDQDTCPAGDSVPCDDIFVLTDPDGAFTSTFKIAGYEYTLVLNLLGLGPLSNSACTAAGALAGCRGLVTEEDGLTDFDTEFSISAALIAVPAPGTLSILALGLACMLLAGFSRKRHIG